MRAVKFSLILFVLTLGTSPRALREFARIQGRWAVIRAEMDGKPAPSGTWGNDVKIVAAGNGVTPQPGSMVFTGVLRPGYTPGQLALTGISLVPDEPDSAEHAGADAGQAPRQAPLPFPLKRPMQSVAIYSVKGDTMKLLIPLRPVKGDRPPTDFKTTGSEGRVLLELRRKPAAAGGTS